MLITHPPAELATPRIWHCAPVGAREKAPRPKRRSEPGGKAIKRNAVLVTLVAILICCCADFGGAGAQELIHFPSLEDNGVGQPGTMLDGYLFRPDGAGPFPAIVALHGCSGMFARGTNWIAAVFRGWAAELNRLGYVFLLVDRLGPRQIGRAHV